MTLPPILLASGSPQRRAILGQIGADFRVVVPDVEEITAGEPASVAATNARLKAAATASHRTGGEWLVAVDPLVALDGFVYAKPANVDDARSILATLRGRTHNVIGGLYIAFRDGRVNEETVFTAVTFRQFS